jgi:hypothetical protein
MKGDFRAFFSTATGYGIAGIRGGKAFYAMRHGSIEVNRIVH